jgi:hypothetical protein
MHPTTGEKLTVSEALARGLIQINWTTGMVTDNRTHETMTSDEAYSRGLIDLHIKQLIDDRVRQTRELVLPITLNEALARGLLNVPLGRIQNPLNNRRMTIEEAIDLGFMDADCSTIINPATKKVTSVTEHIQTGLLNPHSGDLKNTGTGKTMTMAEVVFQGLIPLHGCPRKSSTTRTTTRIEESMEHTGTSRRHLGGDDLRVTNRADEFDVDVEGIEFEDGLKRG